MLPRDALSQSVKNLFFTEKGWKAPSMTTMVNDSITLKLFFLPSREHLARLVFMFMVERMKLVEIKSKLNFRCEIFLSW